MYTVTYKIYGSDVQYSVMFDKKHEAYIFERQYLHKLREISVRKAGVRSVADIFK